jgi:DNA polymerase I-like protein with 3'-5' exonuclease and polymerase domains
MLDYCIRDVDLTEAVYSHLLKEGAGWDWSEAIKLEYNIWDIQQRQEQHGVLFDQKAAEKLLEKIQTEIDTLESEIIKEIPPTYKNDGEVRKVFLKNGEYTQSVKTWLGE